MNLVINISDVAIITGDNTFKTKREYLIDFWKKHFTNDFDKYKKSVNYVKETDNDIITKITLKNSINIMDELKECNSTTNVSDLNIIKNEITKKISHLSENEKIEITKSVSNITNTKFGIRHENDISKLYEEKSGNTIIKDNKYHKTLILTHDNFNIFIGGKIDGYNEKHNTLIEVKNRMHKLFYTLRNYENVQIMCYMHLFKTKYGHLVEALKKKDNTEINIIEVSYNEDYMKEIINKILNFIIYFINFIYDNDAKIKILQNDDEIDF